jgi:hypothetical protein
LKEHMKLLAQSLRNPFIWIIPLLLCAAPGRAATLTVTSTADSGSGSLRAAIISANPGDDIDFAVSLAGQTIHLTSGELVIGKNIAIDASGLGTAVAIDGGGTSRVFEITAGTASLVGLTITNGVSPAGNAGGGILVDPAAALTLNSSTIAGCVANNNSSGGGLFVYGDANATVLFSTISGCIATNGSAGGGFYNDGTAELDYCTLTGNTSEFGGGIYTLGVLTLNECTLVRNIAAYNVSASGGGIYGYGSQTVTLNNCTMVGNLARYGGGIYNPDVTALTNTIVAGNTASSGPDISGFYSGVNNFIGGNPKLSVLGNYGGPTQTMQPLSGSPVIDAGTDSVTNFLTYDQRSSPRLSGAHVDIGAVERQFTTPATRPLVLKDVTRFTNEFQFAFTNAPNVDFTALSSTNLALPLTNWMALGNVTEISSGQYQFTDTSATNRAQFYRVVSP